MCFLGHWTGIALIPEVPLGFWRVRRIRTGRSLFNLAIERDGNQFPNQPAAWMCIWDISLCVTCCDKSPRSAQIKPHSQKQPFSCTASCTNHSTGATKVLEISTLFPISVKEKTYPVKWHSNFTQVPNFHLVSFLLQDGPIHRFYNLQGSCLLIYYPIHWEENAPLLSVVTAGLQIRHRFLGRVCDEKVESSAHDAVTTFFCSIKLFLILRLVLRCPLH